MDTRAHLKLKSFDSTHLFDAFNGGIQACDTSLCFFDCQEATIQLLSNIGLHHPKCLVGSPALGLRTGSVTANGASGKQGIRHLNADIPFERAAAAGASVIEVLRQGIELRISIAIGQTLGSLRHLDLLTSFLRRGIGLNSHLEQLATGLNVLPKKGKPTPAESHPVVLGQRR